MGKSITGVSAEVLGILMHYDYPGNVRELENIIEHCCVMCQDSNIELKHLPPELSQNMEKVIIDRTDEQLSMQAFEKQLIKGTLEKHNWNKLLTAKELGLHRSTLWRKMKKYGLL